MTSRAAQRLTGVGSTIFAEMSALAVRTGSVNLGQGFPDVGGPDAVIDAAAAAMRAGRNQYPPGHGTPELIDAVRRHQARHYDLDLGPEQVVVTTGATEAIAASILGLVDPGDEVVVMEPFYDSYRAMIQFAGGSRKALTLRAPDFRIDPAELSAAITERTKVLLINTPHNPTGRVLDQAERQAICDVAIEHDLVVVTDEVYEHLTFDVPHVPIATMPDMAERTLTLSSSGKTFSFTGWKVGWATGPAELIACLEGAKNWLSYASGAPLQPAIATALDDHEDFVVDLAGQLRAKRDLLCAGLRSAGITAYEPQGTYFVLSDVSGHGHTDGFAFCRDLAERVGVVAIPAQAFYDDQEESRHLVRWAFCKQQPVLEEALERLSRL